MKHTAHRLLLLAALCLPCAAIAQPGDRGPGPRGDGPPPERPDRGERPERGGDRGPENDRWKEPEPIPVELVDEAMATIREMHPGSPWLGRLEELVKENREEAARYIARFPRIVELIEIRKNRPKEFKLHVQNAGLMRDYFMARREYFEAKRAEDQDRMKQARAKVREKVEQMFDMRIKMERAKIAQMKADMAKAEEELANVIARRQEEIEKRTEQSLDRDRDRRRRRGEGDEKKPANEGR